MAAQKRSTASFAGPLLRLRPRPPRAPAMKAITSSGPESFYPFLVKESPMFAREALASILYKLRTGAQLTNSERDYLIDSLGKIVELELSADRALYLVKPRGRHRARLSERNIEIYNRAAELRRRGYTRRRAFKAVAKEQGRAGRRLTADGVEKICDDITKLVRRRTT